MRKKLKRLMSLLLGLALMLGLMPGMTAHAATDIYTNLIPPSSPFLYEVTFNGYKWYIIEDNSTSATSGTVTLFAADTSFGTSVFSESGSSDYSSSTVKAMLDELTISGAFKDVADAIVDTDYGKLYLLSPYDIVDYDNNVKIPTTVRKINFSTVDRGAWWLRSPENDTAAECVNGDDGNIHFAGAVVTKELGVRPALQLDLSYVIFSSETNTFSLKNSHSHSFTWSADGSTITAKCSSEDCGLTDNAAALTIIAPELTTYGGTEDAAAALTGLDAFNAATGLDMKADSIAYYHAKVRDGVYTKDGDEPLNSAPTDAGDYLAEITVNECTASLGYTIGKAENPAVVMPAAVVTKGGNTIDLADHVTLNGAAGAVGYTISGEANGCTISGSVLTSGDTMGTVTVNVTVAEDDNYKALAGTPITVTVIRRIIPTARTLTYTGSAQELVSAGTSIDDDLYYALGKNAVKAPDASAYEASIPTGTDAGIYYVWYKVVGKTDHDETFPACVGVSIDPVDKTDLNSAITDAETMYDSIKDYSHYSEIASALKNVIDAAKITEANDNADADTVRSEIIAVVRAKKTAESEKKSFDSTYAALIPPKESLVYPVTFNGYKWYIIEDDSAGAASGTVTLLAADSSFGTSVFSSNGSSDYSSSTVKAMLDELTVSGAFKDVAEAIADTDYGKLYLLDSGELSGACQKVNFPNVDRGIWWLRSEEDDDTAECVYGDKGGVVMHGRNVREELGVRPALKLDLSFVTFSSETFTFSMNHIHRFTCSAEGSAITATCCNEDCTLTDNRVTLTVTAPELTTYGGTGDAAATLSGLDNFNLVTGLNVKESSIVYYKAKNQDGVYTKDGDALSGAPSDGGDYLAEITVNDCTASLGYTIGRAANPATVTNEAVVIKGGNTVDLSENVSLNGATGEISYAISGDANDCTISGSILTAGENMGTVTVNVTVAADNNYDALAETPITVTIRRIAPTAETLTYTGSAQELVSAGTSVGDILYYALGTDGDTAPEASAYATAIPTGTDVGTYYVWYKVVGEADQDETVPACVEVRIDAVDKTDLNRAISDAEEFYNSIKEDTIYDEIAADLKNAIDAAKAVAENDNVDAETVSSEITAITQAGADAEAVKKIVDDAQPMVFVNGLSDVEVITKENKDSTEALLKSYDKMTETGRAVVNRIIGREGEKKISDLERALEVAERICDLDEAGDISADDEKAVTFAGTAYALLSASQKGMISGELVSRLEAAEEKLEELKAQALLEQEKASAIERLEDYSEAKAKTDATETEKKAYAAVVAAGKERINAAADKTAVAEALKAAKKAVDEAIAKIDEERAAKKYSDEWVDGRWYNKNGTQTYAGIGKWKKNSRGWWYEDSKGWYPKKQWQKIDGKWYYFKANGYLATEEFIQGWWVDRNGVQSDPVKYGWHKTSKGWWYGVKGGWYAKNATYIIDGVAYSFDRNGYCTNP